jgi:hypothetical protein
LAIVVPVDESSLNKREHKPGAPERKPVAEAELRASDADRDRVAAILAEALAEGRLDAEEHAERIDAVYRAKTMGELEPVVRDLPAAGAAPAAHPAAAHPVEDVPEDEQETMVAVFSGHSRKGRWRVQRLTNVFCVFGGVDLDLTEAVFTHRRVRIHMVAVFGGADVKVPENVRVRCTGTGIFGGFDVDSHDPGDPDAPEVVISGVAVFGGASVRRKLGKRLRSWRGN